MRACLTERNAHTKKKDGRTTNGKQGKEAAGNNLPTLTDDDDGKCL